MKLVTLLCLSMNKVICHTLNPIDDNQEGTAYKELFSSDPLTSEEESKCNCDTLQDCSNCDDNDPHTMFLLTVSEIFLATAIIMGLTAVVTIMLRCCTRPVQSYNESASATGLPRAGIRVSLTSLQQRVLSKLRDRPPRYETRHNYEYNQRERPVSVHQQPKSSNEPPPPYDNQHVTTNEQPPSYIVSDLDINSNANQLANRHDANYNNTLHI